MAQQTWYLTLNPKSKIMLVGEAQELMRTKKVCRLWAELELLDKMLLAIDLDRKSIYIKYN